MNFNANPPPPIGRGIGRSRDRLERDYEFRIREFAAVARRVGAGDPERIPELGIRAEALLAFLRVWRGLLDPARQALRLALEGDSPRRLAVAYDAVARWYGLASCRFEAGLAPESEPGFAGEIAEVLMAIEHRTRLRRALTRRLRPGGPFADTLALLLHEVDAERTALLERLRGLEAGWLEAEDASTAPAVTLPPVRERA